MFIDTGMIRLSGNEAQLASVLAHESGMRRRAMPPGQATRNQLIGLGSIPLSIFGGWPGLASRSGSSRGWRPWPTLRLSRGNLNTRRIYWVSSISGKRVTIPRRAWICLKQWHRRRSASPAAWPGLFRAHPVTTDRIDRTQKNIDELLPPLYQYLINTSEYEDIRARLFNPAASRAASEPDGPTLLRNPR